MEALAYPLPAEHPACSAAFWQALVPFLGVSRRLDLGAAATLSFAERVGFVCAVVGISSRSNVHFQREDLIAAHAMCRSLHGERCAEFFS